MTNTKPASSNDRIEQFACETCDFVTNNKSDLTTHRELKHKKKITCNKCEFSTTETVEFKNHKKASHPPAVYLCEHCEYNTIHENQLVKHTKVNHSLVFACKTCPFKARNDTDLKLHMKS